MLFLGSLALGHQITADPAGIDPIVRSGSNGSNAGNVAAGTRQCWGRCQFRPAHRPISRWGCHALPASLLARREHRAPRSAADKRDKIPALRVPRPRRSRVLQIFQKCIRFRKNRRAQKWQTIGLNRSSGQCLGWVNRVSLSACRLLPVCPDQRTSDQPGWSVRASSGPMLPY